MKHVHSFEIKKIYVERKGWIFILFFFLVSLFVWTLQLNQLTFKQTRGNSYFQYLRKMEGPLNEEKIRFMEAESERMDTAEHELTDLYNRLYNGEIDENAFSLQKDILQGYLDLKDGFNQVFSQYNYAREQSENRYLLDDRAWNHLLTSENLDYGLWILLTLLITPIFVLEYEQDMNVLNVSSQRGNHALVLRKMIIGIVSTLLLSCLYYYLHYQFIQLFFPLSHGSFPLQSLPFYGTSSKTVSLLNAYILISLLKTFAFISYTICIFMISVLTKQYAPALLLGLSLIFLPQLIFSGKSTFYRWIYPAGLMLAHRFFLGNLIETDAITGKSIIVFYEIPASALVTSFVLYVVLNLINVLIIIRKECNYWLRICSHPFKKKNIVSLPLIAVLFIVSTLPQSACNRLTAQQNQTVPNKKIAIYNSKDLLQSDGKYVYEIEKDKDGVSQHLIRKDRKAGMIERMSIAPGMFLSNSCNSAHVFVGDGKVYLNMNYFTTLNSITKPLGHRLRYRRNYYTIYEINTSTWETKVIFEKNTNNDSQYLFGTFCSSQSAIPEELGYLDSSIWVNEDFILFFGNTLWSFDRKLNHFSKINIPFSSNIAMKENTLYFVDSYSRLSTYNMQTGKISQLPNMIVLDFILRPEGLYYLDRLDAGKLYFRASMNDSDKPTLLLNKNLQSIWQDGQGEIEGLYYWDKSTNEQGFFELNLEGGSK